MALTWNGTCGLLAGQTAVAYAECATAFVGDVHFRLTITSPDLVIDCYRTGGQFVCEHDELEQMISVVEVLHVTETGQTFSMQVGFKALVDGTADVTFEIVSGSGDVQNASVTAGS